MLYFENFKKYFQLKMFLSKKSDGYKKILGKKIVGQNESLKKKISIEKKFGG